MAGKHRRRKVIYMAVETDKYELPVYIAETIDELSARYKVSQSTIKSSISLGKNGTKTGRKFVSVKNE